MSDFELMIKQAKPSTVWRAAAVLMLGICGVGTVVHFFSLDPLLMYPLQFFISMPVSVPSGVRSSVRSALPPTDTSSHYGTPLLSGL